MGFAAAEVAVRLGLGEGESGACTPLSSGQTSPPPSVGSSSCDVADQLACGTQNGRPGEGAAIRWRRVSALEEQRHCFAQRGGGPAGEGAEVAGGGGQFAVGDAAVGVDEDRGEACGDSGPFQDLLVLGGRDVLVGDGLAGGGGEFGCQVGVAPGLVGRQFV